MLKRHSSLIIMGVYSLVFFLSSVLGKKLLDENEFYVFNVSIVLFSMAFTYCYLGTEQLFVRFSSIIKDRTHISINVIRYMLCCSCLYIVFSTILVNKYIYKEIGYLLPFIIALLVSITVIVYNFYRVNKFFFTAQLILGHWKIILPISIFLSFSYSYNIILSVLLVLSVIFLFFMVLNIKNKVELTEEKHSDILALSTGFAFSLLVLLFLNNLDRWVVEHYLGKQSFSNYSYMLTVTIMPFSLISSYFGFKEVAYLKSKYDKGLFNRKMIAVGVGSFLMFFIWFNFIYFIRSFIDLDLNYELLIPLVILVVSKCIYSLLSALFGLKATKSAIVSVNLYTIMVIVLGFLYLMTTQVTAQKIVYIMGGVWFARMIIFLFSSRKIKEYGNEI
ncbi:hypothetical protein ACJO2B_14430 [Vibrio parahaemolyticus]|uniref:hypothetical protein n=4 Tax=Vibrio parahaemolyticus TaxID=670 RepID=UPI002F33A3FD|nr:hypothetical protein [Vibrio parahaemolyticus]